MQVQIVFLVAIGRDYPEWQLMDHYSANLIDLVLKDLKELYSLSEISFWYKPEAQIEDHHPLVVLSPPVFDPMILKEKRD